MCGLKVLGPTVRKDPMPKYHINAKGEARVCSAQGDNCPFGGELEHYSTPEDARKAYELVMSGKLWTHPTQRDPVTSDYADLPLNEANRDKHLELIGGMAVGDRIHFGDISVADLGDTYIITMPDPQNAQSYNLSTDANSPAEVWNVLQNYQQRKGLPVNQPPTLKAKRYVSRYGVDTSEDVYLGENDLVMGLTGTPYRIEKIMVDSQGKKWLDVSDARGEIKTLTPASFGFSAPSEAQEASFAINQSLLKEMDENYGGSFNHEDRQYFLKAADLIERVETWEELAHAAMTLSNMVDAEQITGNRSAQTIFKDAYDKVKTKLPPDFRQTLD